MIRTPSHTKEELPLLITPSDGETPSVEVRLLIIV